MASDYIDVYYRVKIGFKLPFTFVFNVKTQLNKFSLVARLYDRVITDFMLNTLIILHRKLSVKVEIKECH